MRLYPLETTVFCVSQQAEPFLKGLTSNTLDKPRNAFLDKNARIVATFDQLKTGEDEYLIVVRKAFAQRLLTHLDRYIRLSKVRFEPTALRAYFDLEASAQPEQGEYVIPQRRGQMLITASDRPAIVSEEEFTRFRLENHIPLQGVDYDNIMLLNVDEEEFVSYTKGCFLGQEPISKVHNRAKPPRRLIVAYEDECLPEQATAMTSKVRDPGTGRVKGFVFVSNRD